MTDDYTYLEFSDGTGQSHKFYEVNVSDKTVTIRYGRIGTDGRTEMSTFAGAQQAKEFANGKIREKLKKGYQPATPGEREKRPVVKPVLDARERFWKWIQSSKKESEGDIEFQADVLKQKLIKLPEEQILEFDQVFNELMAESYRADLWGAACLIYGGCSDDSFDYFRAWLIAQGEKVFRSALENPDSLARVADPDAEGEIIMYAAGEAYQEKTGKGDFYERRVTTSPELKGDFSAWDDGEGEIDPEKARRLYPKLYQAFWPEAAAQGPDEGSAVSAPDTAEINDPDQLRLLSAIIENINARDTEGYTPLMRAARIGQVELVKKLLDAGADPHASNPLGETVLTCAIRGNKPEIVVALVGRGVDLNPSDPKFKRANSPLMEAVTVGNPTMVRLLLEAGADVNWTRDDGANALQFAEIYDRQKVIKLLKQAGARRPRSQASRFASQSVLYEILYLHEAAKDGDVEAIRRLLDAAVELETRDQFNRTALMYAALEQQAEAFQLLLDAGADPRAESGSEDVFSCALNGGSADIVRTLIQQGMDVNRRYPGLLQPETPLMMAMKWGEEELISLLIEAGADPSSRKQAAQVARNLGNRKLADLISKLGGASDPLDDIRAKVKAFKTEAETPAFHRAIERLTELCGKAPTPYKRRKGVYCLFLSHNRVQSIAGRLGINATAPPESDLQQRQAFVNPVLDRLGEEMLAIGYCLVQPQLWELNKAIMLLLFPTNDKYAVVMVRGTNANAVETVDDMPVFVGPEQIIAWLQEMEKTNPFMLTACGFDFLAGKFLQSVVGAEALAQKMCEFCPDLVEEEPDESARQVADELTRTQRFFFWWD